MRQIIFSLSLLLLFSFHSVLAHDGENFISSDLLSTMKQGDKAALLMAHFGTTYNETRALTIDAINAKAKAAFPELEVREARGLNDFHVGTAEGYPTFDTVLGQLKAGKAKQVTLVPLMFVAGDHAQNDIDGKWKENLVNNGLKVEVRMEGLGQIPEVQDIFIEHARFIMHHKMLDIVKKAAYAKGEHQHH